jgi:acetyl esterase/lipase
MRTQIRLVKPILKRFSIPTARAFQDNLGDMEAKSLASKVTFEPIEFENFEACFVSPKGMLQDKDKVILYLHGGAYVAGNIAYARGFAGMLAAETHRFVLAVAYRLAPENPFPAAVEDALRAYQYLIESGYNAENISFVGESAGGGLVFALCLKLKEAGLPLPRRLVALSPWTDLTFSGESYKKNKKKDPTLSEQALRGYAQAYAAGQEENPLVSPVFGDLGGMPESLIFAGSYELLLDDAKMLAERLKEAGSPCELIIEEGMWHVFVLFKIPEAIKALKKIAAFLE